AGRIPNLTLPERTVNGQPGLVVQQDGVTRGGGRVRRRRGPDPPHWASTPPREAPARGEGVTRVSGHGLAAPTLAFTEGTRMSRESHEPGRRAGRQDRRRRRARRG